MSIDLGPLVKHIDHNLEVVNENVRQVAQEVAAVSGQVDVVAQQQAQAQQQIQQLYDEFVAFVGADIKQKERQFAATRVIEARQELEKKFGHHDQVRRTATGILQATDVAIVREETMRTAGEELMLACPGYWLAPALVALTSWVQDNRALAEKGLAEALRRDDSKASLFFSLVCRRALRIEASSHWLTRYFQAQNPTNLDRETVVMLDAMANGVFGGAALTACSGIIDEWLGELEQQAGFPEEQRKRWAEAIDILKPKVGPDEYPTLRKYSPTWPRLEAALAAARRNQVVLSFFEHLFAGEINVPRTLETAVDGLLESLVTNFDDEEIPLRREERLLQLIVEEGGDKAAATRRFDTEAEAMQAQTNFAALLSSSAMYPERLGATRATQRYAVSRCRHWIIAAHQDLVARDRAQVPADVELTSDSWKGSSRDGANEKELAAELVQHYASRIERAVAAVGITGRTWAVLAIGGLLGLVIAAQGSLLIGLLIMAGASVYFYFQHRDLDNTRLRVRDELERERDDALRILRACLAELTDLRRETAREDDRADDVTEFLSALSTPQFVLKGPDQARAVLAAGS